MRLPYENPREFVLNLRETLTASMQNRARECAYWDAQFYAGAPPDVLDPAILNVSKGALLTRVGNLFSPDNLSFRIEYDAGTDDPTLQMAARAASFISREVRDAEQDLDFGDGVELALRHGSAFHQLEWDGESLVGDTIPMYACGVGDEQAKDLHAQDAFLFRYSVPAESLRAWLQRIGSAIAVPGNASDGGDAHESEIDRVVFGMVQPIGNNSPGQAGFVNLLPRRPQQPPTTSVLRQAEVDAIWIWNDAKQDYASVFVIDGREVVGADRWRNFFGIKGEHPYTLICPDRVKNYIFGRSSLADVCETQTFVRKRVQDFDRIIEQQAKPSRVGIGTTAAVEKYRAAQEVPGSFVQESGAMAKLESLAPQMPPNMTESISAGAEWARDQMGQPPVVQGRGERGVRAQAQIEGMMLAASAPERRPALRLLRQCGDMGHKAQLILAAKSGELISDGRGGEFLLSSLPNGFHLWANGWSMSPLFALERKATAEALLHAGAIGPEQYLDMLNVPNSDTLRDALQKREAAEAKLIQQHPELLGKKTARAHR